MEKTSEVNIKVNLEGVEEVSEGFRRMGSESANMGREIRNTAREIASLGASAVAVGRLGEQFGLLTKEQANVITHMGSMVALSGTVIRGLGALAQASWAVELAEKARGVAHGFADGMAAGITKIYGTIVSAFAAIASSSFAVAIAEKARATAHAVAHAFSGPWGWAILAAAAAIAATYATIVSGLIKLAEGGIVYKPTIALIGEREPEVVMPLSRIMSWTTKTVSIGSIIINEARTPEETGLAVVDELRRAGVI